MTRGLYNQNQGDESRTGSQLAMAHFADNHIAEGQIVATLRAMYGDQSRWKDIDPFVAKLKKQGHSLDRIQAMLGQASCTRV